MQLLAVLCISAVAGWIVWLAIKPPCAFSVRVTAGTARSIRGHVTQAFLDEVTQMCRRHEIQRATVRGVVRGSRLSLLFSRDVPADAQQQLRNWWAHRGWSVPRTGAQARMS